jgi:hypothetical protein
MNVALFINYLLVVSISGVIVLSILTLLCFLNIEFFKIEDHKVNKTVISMLISVLVILY